MEDKHANAEYFTWNLVTERDVYETLNTAVGRRVGCQKKAFEEQ